MSSIPTDSYPAQYESRLTLKNGRQVLLRPIRHTDGPLLVDLFNKISPDSIYFRFLRPLQSLPEAMVHRFTHVDYRTEFALVAAVEEDGKDAVIAVGRYGYNPDDEHTDFAIAVRDDWQRLGLGRALLRRVLEIGSEHGIRRFWSLIDVRNENMRRMLAELGYEVRYSLRDGLFHTEILV
ncbi:GNAT family N-acetyltransferase [Syntrophobacter fumaroxidans]|uniref:GCN5-related N-acetyltransferase n=1 Tax=Syntrophobacter fumaroxidans (strain DSM 10017 / MPOB) TaxID=335543 RepID=A0LI75_SYNFM|nr:GNAT family N-acetyltransferase [Syntrophobacter fumaroxidans]ABK17127.1 GCN5-related N-acetyltransferase [Syntrophobacter fumaroxidans MPOB]